MGVENWIAEHTSSGTLGSGLPAPVIDKSTVLVGWTGGDGMPDLGALEVQIPFTTASQYVGVGTNYVALGDLSNRVVSACIKVASGLGDPMDLMTNPGRAKLYVKTGVSFCYAAGPDNNVTSVGNWMSIRFDLTLPPDYVDPSCAEQFDPTKVVELGVQFDTGGMTTTARAAVVRIDTLTF
jgi:hypothetical protein